MAELLELDRDEAQVKLEELRGKNLRPIAEEYGVTIFKPNGGFNKGWVGHTIEQHLGLPQNSLRHGDFYDQDGPWELKTVPVKQVGGVWVPKETLAITMISPGEALPDFHNSHLYRKIRRMLIVGRTFLNREEDTVEVAFVSKFDADAPENQDIMLAIIADYEEIRSALGEGEGYTKLTAKIGIWVQPRTKGKGHGSTSRAFYAKKPLVRLWLKLDQ
jgi:DNA mismatch repair protein MutH